MKLLNSILLVGAVAFATAQSTERHDLSRKPRAGETAKYAISLTMEESQKVEVSANMSARVQKASEGKSETEVSWTGFKALSEGQEVTEFEAPPTSVYKIGADGMTETFGVQGSQMLPTVWLVSSYLPNKPLAVGESFKVNWQSKSGSGFMTGDGKLDGIEEKDGKKVAVLKWKASVQPDDVDSPAELVFESRFDLASGILISCKGTGATPGGQIKFSVAPVK